jgi:hypothetical protein
MQTILELIRDLALLNIIVKSSVVPFGVLHNELLHSAQVRHSFPNTLAVVTLHMILVHKIPASDLFYHHTEVRHYTQLQIARAFIAVFST